MPYHVQKKGKKFCVVKGKTGEKGASIPGGCHPTQAEAVKHMRALYKNAKDASLLSHADAPEQTHAYIRLYFQEGELTVDGRTIDVNAINFNRNPPLPIRLQTIQPEHGGHALAEIAGVCTRVHRDGTVIIGDGVVDMRLPAGAQLVQMAMPGPNGEHPILQTWSPDLGAVLIDEESNAIDEDGTSPRDILEHVVEGTLIGFTVVAMPALGSAVFELQDAVGNTISAAPSRTVMEVPAAPHAQRTPVGAPVTANGGVVVVNNTLRDPSETAGIITTLLSPIAACAGPFAPPASFFAKQPLTELQRWVTITEDGHFFGHAAGFGECHIGYLDRCITIEEIADCRGEGNFEYAMGGGHVVTADGTRIGTGPIAVKGGHADKSLSWIKAMAHYDDPACVAADVCYYMDDFGVQFSGAIRPTATEAMIYALRASGVSLDARQINDSLRYLATCCVNTGGFPKVATRITASAEGDMKILALTGAGGPPLPSDDCNCGCAESKLISDDDDLRIQMKSLATIVAMVGLESAAFDSLTDRVFATLERRIS